MTTPGDDSRTELAWREIVENYGERVLLPDDDPHPDAAQEAAPGARQGDRQGDGQGDEPAGAARADAPAEDLVAAGDGDPYDVGPDEPDEPAGRDEVAEVDRFRPPAPPPLPRPRTWQRGVAWSGVFVAPLLALVIAMFSLYVTPLLGWALVAWFVGGFGYLVSEMPRSPRDPWDDGSRV